MADQCTQTYTQPAYTLSLGKNNTQAVAGLNIWSAANCHKRVLLTIGALSAAAVLAAIAAADGVGLKSPHRSRTLVNHNRPSTAAAAHRPKAAPRAIWATAMTGMAMRFVDCVFVRVFVVLARSIAGIVRLNATCSRDSCRSRSHGCLIRSRCKLLPVICCDHQAWTCGY